MNRLAEIFEGDLVSDRFRHDVSGDANVVEYPSDDFDIQTVFFRVCLV